MSWACSSSSSVITGIFAGSIGSTSSMPMSLLGHFVTARGTRIKFLRLRQWASQRGGEEGLRLQSQEGQDLCAAAAAGHLMFKTSTEDQTVHLTHDKVFLRFLPPLRRRIQNSGSWCSQHFTAQKRKEVVKSGWFTEPHKLFVGTGKEVVKS